MDGLEFLPSIINKQQVFIISENAYTLMVAEGSRVAHSDTLGRVNFEHPPNQILRIRWQLLRHVEFSHFDFGEEGSDVVIIER